MKTLILGMDGLDPTLLARLIDQGKLPNFKRLAQDGTFAPLGTSMPPQSPVAWSNFISGALPGTHEIFDFIHRDPNPPAAGAPIDLYLSTSRPELARRPSGHWYSKLEPQAWLPEKFTFNVAGLGWQIPLLSGQSVSLRRGDSFWNHLLARGVDTTIYRIPANYPPPKVQGHADFRCLCGMGTPDLLGTYGTFTEFGPGPDREVGGGQFVHISVQDDHAVGALRGPPNFLRQPDTHGDQPPMSVDVNMIRHPDQDVVRISFQDQVLVLKRGEWSDWTPIAFDTGLPGSTVLGALGVQVSAPAMIRIFIRQVHPDLVVYVSPLNIDPARPFQSIGTPDHFAADLAGETGPYYTTGIPEDTAALRRKALSEDEFLEMVRLLTEERIRQYRFALENFRRGVLFFYFGHTDQLAHVFWRDSDPKHPGRVEAEAQKYSRVIEDTYVQMDSLLAEALQRLGPRDNLFVVSDHGFESFRRSFNLNTWLLQNGYLSLIPRSGRALEDIDWARTRAYAVGINSLFINQRGREKLGIVAPAAAPSLLREIAEGLLKARDKDGAAPIDALYLVNECYPGADPNLAPDMLVGYARGYRGSWGTALGDTPANLIDDNLDRWSGDHCVAEFLVPGSFLCNRRISAPQPSLIDVAPTILGLYGIATPSTMQGRNLLPQSAGPPVPLAGVLWRDETQ